MKPDKLVLPPRLESLVKQYESVRLKMLEKQGEMEHIKRKIGRELSLRPLYTFTSPKWVKVKGTTVKKHERRSFRYVRV